MPRYLERASAFVKATLQHPRFLYVLCGGGLIMFSALLYRGISECGFHHDDIMLIDALNTSKSYWHFVMTPAAIHFSPFLKIHFSLMYLIFGENYPPYFWYLLAFLIGFSFLVWWLIVEMGGSQTTGFIAALLVCAHPCLNDTVFWASGSWPLVQSAFGVLAIILMNRFLRSRWWITYILSLLSYIICMETSEFGLIYLSFLFYCFFWRHKETRKNIREGIYYFAIPFAISAVAQTFWYLYYYLPYPEHEGYRAASTSQYGLIGCNYLVWLFDGLGRYFGIWPEFQSPHTPPLEVIYDRSLAMLFLFLFLAGAICRRFGRLQIIGLVWIATSVVCLSVFVPNARYIAVGLPGFLMFLCPLLTEETPADTRRFHPVRFVNLLLILFLVGHFAVSTESRKLFWINCNKQHEDMRDQIVEKYAHIPEGSLLFVCYPEKVSHFKITGRMQRYSVSRYLGWSFKARRITVADRPIDFDTSVTQLFEIREQAPPEYEQVYFCLWDGNVAQDVTEIVPTLDRVIRFEVGRENVVSIALRRPLPAGSPMFLENDPLPQPGQIILTSGTYRLFLPAGLTKDDATVEAVGREYSTEEFENIQGGSVSGRSVYLLVQDSSFDIATSLTAKTEYGIRIEGQHSRVGTVIVALRTPGSKTDLAKYTFARKDGSISWQEVRITPATNMNRIRFAFISDYAGPEGDVNACITRVRVVRIEPPGGTK